MKPVSSESVCIASLPRCGRCIWWMGRRVRNNDKKTVSFSISGLCSNVKAPPDLANRQVHYLDGGNCPQFKHWKDE